MALVYSCCFWFSLRLGGILIGTFSIMQAILLLIFCCYWYTHPSKTKYLSSAWIKDINLIYVKDFIESLKLDPKKGLGIIIVLTSIYIAISLLYVYGAYKYNNIAMTAYIVIELVRLIGLTVLVTTLLLMLKQNTMDIGLLIGASVIGGFTLLGSFYLWVCAANLPLIIIEKQHYDQVVMIEKLQQLVDAHKLRVLGNFGYENMKNYNEELYRNYMYNMTLRKKNTQQFKMK